MVTMHYQRMIGCLGICGPSNLTTRLWTMALSLEFSEVSGNGRYAVPGSLVRWKMLVFEHVQQPDDVLMKPRWPHWPSTGVALAIAAPVFGLDRIAFLLRVLRTHQSDRGCRAQR